MAADPGRADPQALGDVARGDGTVLEQHARHRLAGVLLRDGLSAVERSHVDLACFHNMSVSQIPRGRQRAANPGSRVTAVDARAAATLVR